MKIDSKIFDKRMSKLEKVDTQAFNKTFPEYKKNTPIKSGNARRKTFKSGLKFKSNYPYAGRLDEGWSKQAPKGFTSPSIDFFVKTLERLVGKI